MKLRDWASETAPAEIYADIVEACVICEGTRQSERRLE